MERDASVNAPLQEVPVERSVVVELVEQLPEIA